MVMLLTGPLGPTLAQSATGKHERSVAQPQSPPNPLGPSLQFLEFLGEWETENGEWLDPMEIKSITWPDLSSDAPNSTDAENTDVQ